MGSFNPYQETNNHYYMNKILLVLNDYDGIFKIGHLGILFKRSKLTFGYAYLFYRPEKRFIKTLYLFY